VSKRALRNCEKRQAPIIGITGNIGSGKSTVATLLADRGVHLIDADRVVHALYAERSGPLARAVVDAFGKSVLAPDGSIDRAALGSVVFGCSAGLRKLEGIVHPVVVSRVEEMVKSVPGDIPIAIEAIKLIESELVALLDEVWIVTATRELQIARLEARGMTYDEARRRLEVQSPIEDKVALLRQKRGASIPVATIENTTTLARLRSSVNSAWRSTQKDMRITEEL
jgi:dephospho-CoA kinase